MDDARLDRIHIRDLRLRCIVGVYPEERLQKQDVILDVVLYADLRAAGRTDDLADTVDYKALKKRIVEAVEASSYQLIERLAQAVADLCLEEPRVRRVQVTLDKPGALRFARSVAVQIVRHRESDAGA
jgi:dihydroneopterin aldolase/D-erythro-7,8-dihydroneopterin triphosphate epimerase